MSPKKDTQRSAKSTTAAKANKRSDGFTAEERAVRIVITSDDDGVPRADGSIRQAAATAGQRRREIVNVAEKEGRGVGRDLQLCAANGAREAVDEIATSAMGLARRGQAASGQFCEAILSGRIVGTPDGDADGHGEGLIARHGHDRRAIGEFDALSRHDP